MANERNPYMTNAMKAYKTEVAKRKGQYASSDRMTAMAAAAGKKVPKPSNRSMPGNPLKRTPPKQTVPRVSAAVRERSAAPVKKKVMSKKPKSY